MKGIIEADLPFTKRTWRLEDAVAYFEQDGQADKVALLKLRPFDYFPMYRCEDMWEYFYGAMVPSTRYVPHFSLRVQGEGFVLQLPNGESPDAPAPWVDLPQHLSIFSQSAHWCSILGVENVSDLNSMQDEGSMRNFIRVNEALHAKAIGNIADRIAAQGARIILIAGPSSSGKTSFAARLGIHLQVLGLRPVQISLDNYYLNRDTLPREADGSVDLESIHTLDLPLFRQHMKALLAGETVDIPRFDFSTGTRKPEGIPTQLAPNQPILVEGIHGLNPLLSEGIPKACIHKIFVSALTCINLDDHNRIRTTDVRLLRRIVRDMQFRGTPPEETLSMWNSVRAGEQKWIFPYQEEADSMFNTALHYELPLLKGKAHRVLQDVPENSPWRLLSQRLVKMLNYVPDVPDGLLDEIPPTSILREFLGGSTLDVH